MTLDRQCRDYHRIEKAIHFLHENRHSSPSLAEAAAHANLSEHHFQRLFARWAGVSPKRYLQFLQKSQAMELLKSSAPVLEAALKTGLSGSGRLHDLMITTEAATPGEIKTGGRGLQLRWSLNPSPFGTCLVALSERGICHLSFSEAHRGEAEFGLRKLWPGARLLYEPGSATSLIERIFSLEHSDQPLHLLLKGTNFQLKVWTALLKIPASCVTSYGRLARAVGNNGASRAIGGAIGANPIAYLIPCHRVIRAFGEFGGYRWGPVRKQLMLLREFKVC